MRDIQRQGDANATTLGEIEREKRRDNPAGRGVPDERTGVNPSADPRAAMEEGRPRKHAPDEDKLPDMDPLTRK